MKKPNDPTLWIGRRVRHVTGGGIYIVAGIRGGSQPKLQLPDGLGPVWSGLWHNVEPFVEDRDGVEIKVGDTVRSDACAPETQFVVTTITPTDIGLKLKGGSLFWDYAKRLHVIKKAGGSVIPPPEYDPATVAFNRDELLKHIQKENEMSVKTIRHIPEDLLAEMNEDKAAVLQVATDEQGDLVLRKPVTDFILTLMMANEEVVGICKKYVADVKAAKDKE